MTQTEIANRALAHLGAHRIVDMGESSPSAEHIRRCWDAERRATLRLGHWNFAKARAVLSATTAPAFGWTKAYVLPADCLALIAFNGILAGTSKTDFEVEAGLVLSNSETAQLAYIRDVPDCTQWDDVFVQAFALRMAAAIAPSLTASSATAAAFIQEAERVLGSARVVNATDTRPDVIRDDCEWLRVRGGAQVL